MHDSSIGVGGNLKPARDMKFQFGLRRSAPDSAPLSGANTGFPWISPMCNHITNRASAKSVLISFIVILILSFTILQVAFPVGVQNVGSKAWYHVVRQWQHFSSPQYDVCLALSIGDDGDQPNETALPYPLVSRLTEALKEEVAITRAGWRRKLSWRYVQVLVGVDLGSIVCLIVRDTFAEVAGVNAKCTTFSEIVRGTKCRKLVEGSSKKFVPQVPQEWYETLKYQSQRLVDLDGPDPPREPPALPEEQWRPTVVTGFSTNHMVVGLLMLRSIAKAMENNVEGFNVSVVVWAMDLFKKDHQKLLQCVIDEMDQKFGVKVEVRQFDWAAYPSWMRINQVVDYYNNGGTGEYAWKAIMMHTVLRERGMALWVDAGDRFHTKDSLIQTMKTLNSTGFVSRRKDGTIRQWTHPLQLKYYRANYEQVLSSENCVASIAGFTLKKYREIARPWYDCSMTRQCIAPDGSNRKNHRQDQAALSVLSVVNNCRCEGAYPGLVDHAQWEARGSSLGDVTGTYLTKCYADPLSLEDQGY